MTFPMIPQVAIPIEDVRNRSHPPAYPSDDRPRTVSSHTSVSPCGGLIIVHLFWIVLDGVITVTQGGSTLQLHVQVNSVL